MVNVLSKSPRLPLPHPFGPGRQNISWLPNVLMPPMVPSPDYPTESRLPLYFHKSTPKPQHNQVYQQGVPKQINQYNKHHQPQSKLNHNEVKTEIKDPRSFVPLQAQKKSRNIANKQTDNDTNKCAKENPQSVIQQKKKELPTKVCYNSFLFNYNFIVKNNILIFI